MMPPFLDAWIGALVWAVANVVYIDLRRKGDHGFGRILAFFAGMPTTWITLFAVREGSARRVRPPLDDEGRLLREIRVDRELRERRVPRAPAVEATARDEPEDGR